MKILRELIILIFISFLGEIAKALIPIKFPSTIYGLIILFIFLKLKLIKENEIKNTSDVLLKLMPLFFVPAAINIINIYHLISDYVLIILITIILSSIIIIAVTAICAEIIFSRKEKNHG